MKAKLVKEIPQREGLPYWFRKYEFECIDCGEHYFSGKCTERTNPYCPECNRKHEREKQRYYQEQKKQRAVNEVLDKIRAEISEAMDMEPAWKGQDNYVGGLEIALSIIDKTLSEVSE